MLISIDDQWCKSSGRSIDGLNLFDALSNCSDILEKFGGHAYAAGFLVKEEYISELDTRLNEYAIIHSDTQKKPVLYIDSEITVMDINAATIRKTEVIGPYGAGNRVPVFALKGAKILDVRTLSDGKHCRILAESEDRIVEAIAFGAGNLINEFYKDDVVDLAGELNINLYNGQVRLQLILCGIRLSHKEISDLLPNQQEFADIYKFLRANGDISQELYVLSKKLGDSIGKRIMSEKLLNALEVFQDVGIVKYQKLGSVVRITIPEVEKGKKVSLAKSKVYIEIKEKLTK